MYFCTGYIGKVVLPGEFHILSPEGHCLFEVVMSFKLFNYLFISSCVLIMGHYFTMSVITLPLITCVIANSRLEFLFLQCTL